MRMLLALAAALIVAPPALAQQRPPAGQAAPAQPSGAQPAQGRQQAQPQPSQPSGQGWERMPRMNLEAVFAGPLRDTIVQRWRDPANGVLCYLYLPVTAPHSAPTASGYVQYGAVGIGTISCLQDADAKPKR